MTFTDLPFLFIFLPLCFVFYYTAKSTEHKNFVLIVFSLVFYAFGEPVRILLLLFSVLINYFAALSIAANRHNRLAKVSVVVSLIYNIGMLVVFKYSGFIVSNVNNIFGAGLTVPKIMFPVGISFYTFQIISYVIDVYWEKIQPQRQFPKLLLYVSLFPQLTEGPIVRYETVADELDGRRVLVSHVSDGLSRVVVGLAKKVIIANNLYSISNELFGKNIAQASVAATWLGVITYSLYVYYDFSGYSDMALGLGRMFGFRFEENFNYPFICGSIAEFWQRWHISLGTFFRDYLLYLPIFGKRRQYASLFLVWFTTGLWHGASWNFIMWGMYFGVFLFIETLIGKKKLKKVPLPIMHIYTKIVVVIGFGIFKFQDLGEMGNFFKNLVGLNQNVFVDEGMVTILRTNLYIILAAVIFCIPILPMLKNFVDKRSYGVRSAGQVVATCVCAVLLGVSVVLLFDKSLSNVPFLYRDF